MRSSHSAPEGLTRQLVGFTLLEASVAVAIVGLFLSTLLAMSSNMLGLLRTAKDNISATQALQERVEKMRIANWLQITDATYLANSLMATASDSTTGLGNPVETVTVTAYRNGIADPTVRAEAVRQSGGTRIIAANAALKNERMVRVDLNLRWEGFPRSRPRERATTTLIAKGGIAK
jgi:hypothetical protein